MAVRFDAVNEEYTATTGVNSSTTFTVLFWVHLSVNRATFSSAFSLDSGSTAGQARLYMETTAGGVAFNIYDGSDNGQTFFTATVGTWHAVAVVCNGTTTITGYSGTDPGALTSTTFGGFAYTLIPSAPANLRIGRSPFAGEWLNGRIANFKLYAAALTSTEVAAELASWSAVRTSNLVRHHQFRTTSTADDSGNGNTLSGGTGATSETDPPVLTAGQVSYVASSTPTPVGTTTTASTTAVTPTLPVGTASGDRVYVVQAGNNTNGGTPTSWTAVATDVQAGPTGTAPGAGTGRRYLSVFYRDYDGVWTMPSFTLTSAAQNTNACSAITMRKSGTDTWGAPAASTAGNTASASTAYSVTTGSLTTITNGLVLLGVATNDNVTASAETLTGGSMTLAKLSKLSDTGSATGNDVAVKTYLADVSAGGTGTLTHAATLSAASEGGTLGVAQSSTAAASAVLWPRRRGPNYRR